MAKNKFRRITQDWLASIKEPGWRESLLDYSKTPEGKESGFFPKADGSGVRIGRGFGYCEYEGEGLPDGEGESLSFDIRVVDNRDQTVELLIARKGSGRHFKFEFDGLHDSSQPIDKGDGLISYQNRTAISIHEFLRCIEYDLPMNLYYLLWACLLQFEDRSRKKEAYDNIRTNLEWQFKPLLIWDKDRFKIIDEQVIHGIKTTTSVPTESGRTPGSKSPRKLSKREEQRKSERLTKIKAAIKTSGYNNENKAELARIIGITAPTFRAWLKSIGVTSNKKFYDLIREVESH